MHTITKNQCSAFLKTLAHKTALYAPVKRKLVMYERITDPALIHLETNAYFPLKQHFFKPRTTLLRYKQNAIQLPEYKAEEKVFFGVRRCDLNAIAHQDMVFLGQYSDPHYKAEREASTFIGYHCPKAPSEYCFCGSLDLKEFHDLMFYDRGDHYLVHVGSEKGQRLLDDHQEHFSESKATITEEDKKIPGSDRLHTLDLAQYYNNPGWKKGVGDCLSCGACTALCPTCYCFEIHDEKDLKSETEGARIRSWSSCQLPEFTQVAGGHTFREDREQRFKHRIYHQLDYFKKKMGVNLCTGCGRCISGCPTRIDFVDIINTMHKSGGK